MRTSPDSMKRIALRAAGLVIVLPAIVVLALFRDNLEGKEVALGLLLVVSGLGFWLVWSMIRAMTDIQSGLSKIARGEADSLNLTEGPTQLREMTEIINALNQLTIDFKENASQLEKFIQQFAALTELTEVTAKVPDIHDLLGLVLQKAVSGANAYRGTVMLMTEDRHSFELVSTQGWSSERTHLAVEGSLAQRVVETGKPLLVGGDGAASELGIAEVTDAELYTSNSFLILPLRTKSNVVGVVCLAEKITRGSFTSHDQQFLTVLLGQIGFAIENARLLNQAREAAKDLKRTVADQEVQIQAAQGRILQAEKLSSLGQLAGGVAHDFNNLLQGILAYSKLAQQEMDDGSRCYEDIGQVRKAAERAANLTRQLLAFGRRQVLQPTHINLNEVIHEITKMLRRLVGEHIELEVAAGDDLSTVYADVTQIEQVLMNLCINARDATPDGGRVTISSSNITLDEVFCDSRTDLTPGEYVLLRVTDRGSGMNEETLRQAFEPFFTTKEVGRGTGLGLATVYGIVKQHGGFIDVESRLGEGSTFSIYLPAVDAPAATTEKDPVVETSGGNETILVAEDEDAVRSLIVRILEGAGYQVLVAHDGLSAAVLFEQNSDKISLALLDVVMPKMSGREAMIQIREIRPDVPILFSSGYSSDAVNTGFIHDEDLPLIQKPFDPDDLLIKVRSTLDAELARV